MSYARLFGCIGLFASLLLTNSLSAQQGLPPAYRIRPLPLLVSESVQKEIELTGDQMAKVTALHKDFQEALAKLFPGTSGIKDVRELSDEQRTKLLEGIRKINDDFEPKTKEILKPEQFERAQQIAYQLQGPEAFRNPDVIKSLELNKNQQEKMTIINKDYQEKIQALGVGPAAFTKVNKIRDEQTAELVKALTKDQTDKWMALRGKAFDISTIRFGARTGDKEKKAD
jgi:hypothetical protein